jgi:trk system potassium uptake protein TrkH
MDLEGGFRSLGGYADSPWVNLPVMLLIQGGTLSYFTLHDVWSKRQWRLLTLDVKLVLITNAVLLIGGGLAFLALEWGNVLGDLDGGSKVLAAMFQSTTMRTAGFSTVSFTDAHPATLFISMGIMMVGGAAGSTAGGIKLATLAILVLMVVAAVRGREEPGAFGRRIAIPLVYRAMTVTALFLLAHFVFTLALAITENVIAGKEFGFLPLMFETMSGLASVGLSTGITPDLSAAGKLILCLCIYLGRLGPLMAVYALQTAGQPTRYRLPEAPVRIG